MNKKEIKIILDPYNEDIKRHMSVLSEDFQSKVDIVVEQFDSQNKRLDAHTEMIGILMEDITTIKNNVEFIKGSLKKKVDYDEFLALERRLSLVEKKVR